MVYVVLGTMFTLGIILGIVAGTTGLAVWTYELVLKVLAV
jgi:hypothetical protein